MKKLLIGIAAILVGACTQAQGQEAERIIEMTGKIACITGQLVFTQNAGDIAKACNILQTVENLAFVEQVKASNKSAVARAMAESREAGVCK